jgi:hypothetical protein
LSIKKNTLTLQANCSLVLTHLWLNCKKVKIRGALYIKKRKESQMKIQTFIIFSVLLSVSSCVDKYPGGPFCIQNNSNDTLWYWYPNWKYYDNWPRYCFPDTVLPFSMTHTGKVTSLHITVTKRLLPGNIRAVGEQDPDYQTIFASIPSGKLSVYFFKYVPETKTEWDAMFEKYDLFRKDVTLQELIDNEYIISYP